MTNTPNDSSLREKVFGCLLGVAIEDTLGTPFEHLLPDETNHAIDKSGEQQVHMSVFAKPKGGEKNG